MKAIIPNIETIESIEDIQRLAVAGFTDWRRYGHVTVRAKGDLLIFNYTTMAMITASWNFFERVSRGLIINTKTGEIVARGFDKFFNWLEGGRKAYGHIVTVTEKVDGSVGILYRDGGNYHIATRGAFESDQAKWATRFLNENYDLTGLPDELTLIFEIIYPENRIVVDYGTRQELVLLAARNRHTGDYLPFFPDVYSIGQEYGFALPQVYPMVEIGNIIAAAGALDANNEGYVVESSDGSRWKFKGDRYLELQRLISGLTFKNVLRAVSSGSTQQMFDTVPDEFLAQVRAWIAEIEAKVAEITMRVNTVYADAPKESRKEFALWVRNNHPELSPYLFAMMDGMPLEPLIYRTVDWGRHDDPGIGEEN
jgi:RNA ligase